jgi:hypothetical protein
MVTSLDADLAEQLAAEAGADPEGKDELADNN